MIKFITCEEFSKNFQIYLEGRLDPIQEQRFIQHVRACVKCKNLNSTLFVERTEEDGFGWLVKGGTAENLKHCLNSSSRLEYAKGGMTGEEREQVRDHINNCSYCRGLVHAEIMLCE